MTMDEARDKARDLAAYTFEGETNYPLHPDPVVRRVTSDSFDRGFDLGWKAALGFVRREPTDAQMQAMVDDMHTEREMQAAWDADSA